MAVSEGITTKTMNAVLALISAGHADDLDVIAKSHRNPFEALEDGDLERRGTAVLLSRTADIPGRRSSRGGRADSNIDATLWIVVMLHGRSGFEATADEPAHDRTYEQSVDLLYNLGDAITATLEAAGTHPTTTFANITIGEMLDAQDPDNLYIATQTRLSIRMIRLNQTS